MKIPLTVLATVLILSACQAQTTDTDLPDSIKQKNVSPLVTFVELGSVNCIPCKKMQPVMKSIEARFGAQIKVVFYDVWRTENKQYAVQYRVQAIPTQVFLDARGNEFFRHMGYFDEASIEKLLMKQGLKPTSPIKEE